MKHLLLLTIFVFLFSMLRAQNVGIDVAVPLQKLHIAGNTNTLRLEGLSSVLGGTHIISPSAITDLIMYVNANGDFKAIPTGSANQVLSINSSGVPAWATIATSSTSWDLLGNSATNPVTNFLGTTDAKDLVFRTTNIERLRITSGGTIGMNVTPTGTELLTVSGGSSYNGLNATTTKSASGSYAVRGVGVTNMLAYLGYVGTIVAPVIGNVTNPSGYFTAAVASNVPLVATTAAPATTCATLSTSSVWHGGLFETSVSGANAVIGANSDPNGTAFLAIGNGVAYILPANGTGTASFGATSGSYNVAKTAASGTGAICTGNGITTPTVYAAGGGVAANGKNVGIFSLGTTAASATGVLGVGNNLATNSVLVTGSGGAFNGATTGLYLTTTPGASASEAIYSVENANVVRLNYWDGSTQWKVAGLGTMPASCTVKDNNGHEREMYSAESPDFLFNDYGQGSLINGTVHIAIDPILMKNIIVDETHPLLVFVQLRGNCNGVYVSNESATGFDVTELNSGKSNTSFNYQITARVADATMANGNVNHLADIRFKYALEPRGEVKTESVQLIMGPEQIAPTFAAPK